LGKNSSVTKDILSLNKTADKILSAVLINFMCEIIGYLPTIFDT
tara:strand:- start:3239 stop:3370 length:132 start_codon:yes stop_codon:yes gene_type:complete